MGLFKLMLLFMLISILVGTVVSYLYIKSIDRKGFKN